MSVQLILRAYQFDDGQKVTKVGGEKEYTLLEQVKIFGEGMVPVKADGIMFLVGKDGSINAIPKLTFLKADMDYSEAIELIQRLDDDQQLGKGNRNGS